MITLTHSTPTSLDQTPLHSTAAPDFVDQRGYAQSMTFASTLAFVSEVPRSAGGARPSTTSPTKRFASPWANLDVYNEATGTARGESTSSSVLPVLSSPTNNASVRGNYRDS